VGTNFQISDDTGRIDQNEPAIAVTSSGDFVITWQEYRSGNYDIFAQHYTGGGIEAGENYKINDDTNSINQADPVIAVDRSGNFIIVWRDNRRGLDDIYVQMYDSNGAALGVNFRVNNELDDTMQAGDPSIALDDSGNFIITWNEDRNNNYYICAQRYAGNGDRIGENFQVNDNIKSTWKWDTVVAVDKTGKFIILWQDYRNGDCDLYGQWYNSNGEAVGSNFRVNDDTSARDQDYHAAAFDGAGNVRHA